MKDRNTEESAALRQAVERYEGTTGGESDLSRTQTCSGASVSPSDPQPFINETLMNHFKMFPTSGATETNLFQRGQKCNNSIGKSVIENGSCRSTFVLQLF